MSDFVDFGSDLSDEDISFACVNFPEDDINFIQKTNADRKEVESQHLLAPMAVEEPATTGRILNQNQWVKIRVPPKNPPCAENTVDFSYASSIVKDSKRDEILSEGEFSRRRTPTIGPLSTSANSLSTPVPAKNGQRKSNHEQPHEIGSSEHSKPNSNTKVPPSTNHLEKMKVPGSSPSKQLPPVELTNFIEEEKGPPPNPGEKEHSTVLHRVDSSDLKTGESDCTRQVKITKLKGKPVSASDRSMVIKLAKLPRIVETEGKKKPVFRKRKRSASTSYKRDFSYSPSNSISSSSRRTKKIDHQKLKKDNYEGQSTSRSGSYTCSSRSSHSRSKSRSSGLRSRSRSRSYSRSQSVFKRPLPELDPKFLREDLKPEDLDLSKYDSEGRKIFIGNLSYETTKRDLTEGFGKYGSIETCYIASSRIIGFVVYHSVESAIGAVRRCNQRQVILLGRKIKVYLAKAREFIRPEQETRRGRNRSRSLSRGRYRIRTRSRTHSRSDKDHEIEGRKVFVGRLPLCVKEIELKEIFEPYGEIYKCYMPKRSFRGDVRRHMGVGFIIYKKEEDALKAVQEKNQTELHGKFIQVKIAQPPSKDSWKNNPKGSRYDEQGRKLHIGNIPVETKDRDLKGMFEEFGEIEECYIPLTHGNERPMGYGFVTFKLAEDADAALRHWNGKMISGRTIVCQKAKAQEKRRLGFRGRRRA